MSELNAYLHRQIEGQRVDSSGKFTVDFAKARQKLALFQLTRPTDYLLKLVQAGVLAQCERLEVELSTRVVLM